MRRRDWPIDDNKPDERLDYIKEFARVNEKGDITLQIPRDAPMGIQNAIMELALWTTEGSPDFKPDIDREKLIDLLCVVKRENDHINKVAEIDRILEAVEPKAQKEAYKPQEPEQTARQEPAKFEPKAKERPRFLRKIDQLKEKIKERKHHSANVKDKEAADVGQEKRSVFGGRNN